MSDTARTITQDEARALLAALKGLLDALERDMPQVAAIATGPVGEARAAIAKVGG